jgi:hypothetical protein
MPLRRVRFTIRRLMVATAIVAVGLSVEPQLWRDSTNAFGNGRDNWGDPIGPVIVWIGLNSLIVVVAALALLPHRIIRPE